MTYEKQKGICPVCKKHFDIESMEADHILSWSKGARRCRIIARFLDPKRVGMIGWSHGGAITLLTIMKHPAAYAVAYAGVPVSDLVARMGYEPEEYRQLYSAPYHIGKTVREDVEEYRKRSPVNHVKSLATPLLIHANTNDEDVNYLEVEHLIQALKAEGKKFEYKVYQDAPGGHYFNRTDTKLARDSRAEIYKFLAGYLHPGH